MHEDPIVALSRLTAALERHLDACSSKRAGSDQEIQEAYDQVADAFEKYEDVLDTAFSEVLPLIAEGE